MLIQWIALKTNTASSIFKGSKAHSLVHSHTMSKCFEVKTKEKLKNTSLYQWEDGADENYMNYFYIN